MGLFGFGVSKQDASSQSQGYGYSGSSSVSDSLSQSRARSGGVGASKDTLAFADLFQNLFTGASGAASKLAGNTGVLTNAANSLFTSGAGFVDQLSSGGAGDAYLEKRLSADNPALQDQIDALGGDIGRFLSEQVNPAITSQGVASGTLGGGRQGVAQGAAARAATEQFTQGATALRGADVAARDAAAGTLSANRTAAAGTGLGALSSLYGLAQGGFNAELSPYLALAQIMGGPTVLGESSTSEFSESTSDAIQRALAASFGEDFSSSSSKSKGRSYQLEAS